MGSKKKAKSPWKRQKTDKFFPKMNYNKFPKYPKRILVYSGHDEIFKFEFFGFLIRLEAKRSNIHFKEIDIYKAFNAKGRKTKNYLRKEDFYFPNYDRTIHVFNGYDCVAEIDIRGIIHTLYSNKTFYSFHIQNTYKDYLV